MEATAIGTDRSQRGLVQEQVSTEMVRIYKKLFGRGPTRVRTNFAGPDALLCTLENSFTPAEQSLVSLGELQRLRETRMIFQYASEKEFVGTVERITQRKVTAFVSGLDAAKDVSAELFYLEPEADPR